MKLLKKIYILIHQFVSCINKAALISMILIVFLEVISRNILNSGISWSYEVATKLMAWFAFLSMAQGVKEQKHLSIIIFFNLLPKKAKKIIEKFTHLAVFIFGCSIIYYGIQLTRSTWRSTLPATQFPAGILYLVAPIAGFIIVINSILFLFNIDYYFIDSYQKDEQTT
ncbi:TRAP-type C4-dicarboxylate transport system permease small subunit [Natranaerovirga hydrolytica]|uniref:TRAP-type C4-dicarboxylate transport system permease small subunit n=1 Tax=Natranaerovirga hydrolytica TaxID=680378 RepID=A0A4R1MKA0_9FIRM|nr:TRAP transporter small permease [Natranaerovirga hydrolytica]TCK93238.1 TRAP-type C4-dicarboxylate transport system permease small subunit [Natranaerovirga hydrolytica]